MKTTVELPDALLKEVKMRAVSRGRKLKDEIAELLRAGLSAGHGMKPKRGVLSSPRIGTDPETGFPVIASPKNAPVSKMTIEQILALEENAQTEDDLERLGLSR